MGKYKKFAKAGVGLTVGTIGLGIGANVAEGISPGSGAGIANFSRALPPTGTILGAGMTLGALKDLEKTTHRKKARLY